MAAEVPRSPRALPKPVAAPLPAVASLSRRDRTSLPDIEAASRPDRATADRSAALRFQRSTAASTISAPEPSRLVTAGDAPPVAVLPETPAASPLPAIDPPVADVPADDALVRATLSHYAAAYSALDADAAQRVWPRVNRDALTRAFDGLASQHVALGDCRVRISNASARANCSGSTTWVPKIGSGSPRMDPRRWDFELTKTTGEWQIVSARVQNR